MIPSPLEEALEKLRVAKARYRLLQTHKASLYEKYIQACTDTDAAGEHYTKMLAEFDKALGEGVL